MFLCLLNCPVSAKAYKLKNVKLVIDDLSTINYVFCGFRRSLMHAMDPFHEEKYMDFQND